jgi:hypothetical protein
MSDPIAGAKPRGESVPSTNNEDPPLIIWTFRRTGGTSLKSILFWLSNRPSWPDEAFNDDRELGGITRAFEESGDQAALEAEIERVVAQRKNLKHCIEVVPYEVTSALLRHSVAAGYRHLVLLRLNEVERQLSLALAKVTQAWGPEEAETVYAEIRDGRRKLGPLDIGEIRLEMERDAAALGRLVRLLHLQRVPFTLTFFEDLYEGPLDARVAEVRRIAATIGLARAAQEPDDAFYHALTQCSQGTKDIYRFVPNILEVEQAVRRLTS